MLLLKRNIVREPKTRTRRTVRISKQRFHLRTAAVAAAVAVAAAAAAAAAAVVVVVAAVADVGAAVAVDDVRFRACPFRNILLARP